MIGYISSPCPEISAYNDIHFTTTDCSTTKRLPQYFSLPVIRGRKLTRVGFIYLWWFGSAKSHESNEMSTDSSGLLKLAFPDIYIYIYIIPFYARKKQRQ
jgi:hypothetical protein